jgi:hypothetical protein
MASSKNSSKNPPVAKIRVSGVTVSIWENKGEKGTAYSATFDRRYRDAEGEWHSSSSYNADDLLALAKAADLAHTKILELQNNSVGE